MNEVRALLLSNLEEAFGRRAWHGTSLSGSLRGVTAAESIRRPGKGRHNIWELTVHAAYWKYAVRRRFTGEKRGSFTLKGSNWFTSPARIDEKSWKAVVALLNLEHRLLRDTISALDDKVFRDPRKLRLITGIANHDLYHTGQIQIVKRLIR